MSYTNKNKEILLNQYPGLWEEINTKDEGDKFNDVNVETAQTGEPVLRINGMYIHSPRDPLREGQRLAQACSQADVNGEKPAIVILGFGLGYSAQSVAEAAKGLGRQIIIVEKHKSLFLKALELRDFSDFLGNNRIIFVIGGSGEAVTSALSIANELSNDGDENAKKIAPYIINNKALTNFDEQWYKQVEDRIRSWTMRDSVNTATHKRFGRRWSRNFARNMSVIRDYPGITKLSNLAAAKTDDKEAISPLPVFLAAAGPSLDKITPLLCDIYERCIIVAVDTNLRFFVKNNIQPDFVLVVDPQFWNSRHLDRCVTEKINLRTALVAEPSVYPPVLKLPFKNKFLCSPALPLGVLSKGASIQKQG